MSNERSSNSIWIEDGIVHYELATGGWQLPVSDIKVIGEHTDDHGPYVDDYFIVFLTDSHLYEASFYAEGLDQFLSQLTDLLGSKVDCSLVNSTEFHSRVMWPSDIEGRPFFTFVLVPRPPRFAGALKHKILPLVAYHLTEEVKGKVTGATGHSRTS